ncbi:MAG: citramalate synthase [Candidatus Ancillula trichonymphae]|jgi:2-isopropylmalate synthase|nr:citramalate synthase [Candidatus Ancillula trichonymphae]
MKRRIEIYDTSLRDGAQQQGVNFSVVDKLKIVDLSSSFGIGHIEGGWPGAIPKDTELFEQSPVPLYAFGATRKPGISAQDDEQLRGLLLALKSNTHEQHKGVCLVAKTDILHVKLALRTLPDENLQMIEDSVQFFRAAGSDYDVVIDAEHYFDGFARDKEYAIEAVATAFKSGARCVVLCDTNGGAIPSVISSVVSQTIQELSSNYNIEISTSAENPEQKILGIHAHNDTGCAVANTLVAVEAGVAHVQGTVNEYGERTGNANLVSIIANLALKLDCEFTSGEKIKLGKLYNLAHNIAEIANININARQPYVGDIAFAHKAGLHTSALKVNPDLYQHIDPKVVGNDPRIIISEMAGRSSIELKANELGFDITARKDVLDALTSTVKDLEKRGYAFDLADASFELLLREELGVLSQFFVLESWRTICEKTGSDDSEASADAVVKLIAGGKRFVAVGEGDGPVNALDNALRDALKDVYPEINNFELVDYRVRLLDTGRGTGSVTRVLITCINCEANTSWTTIGVGSNIIESSWEALTDCYIFGLISSGVESNL